METVKTSPYAVKPAEIIEAAKMTEMERYFKIILREKTALGHSPGQFVMVSVPGIGEVPISVSSAPGENSAFELVVRKAGAVTAALHRMGKGDTVGIRGPFGRGFPEDVMRGNDIMFIAGGIGIVPLRSLINRVFARRDGFGRVYILLGAKTPQDMLFSNELEQKEKEGAVRFLRTVDVPDENWKGNTGLITSLIPLVDVDSEKTFAVIVGPPVMYKFVIMKLLEKKIPEEHIFVSLERRMKCGVGKCGHCQIGGYYCCRQGPVFSLPEIKYNIEAI